MMNSTDMNDQKTASILRSHSDHAMITAYALFEPVITFVKKLPNVAEAVLKRSKAPHWATTSAERYLIRETKKKYFYHFDHQSFFCQTLGLDPWLTNLEDHIEVMSIAFNKMDVTKIKRVGLGIAVQLPLDMSHSEMVDLMFGSFLVDREELTNPFGTIDDLLLQLHGNYKGIKSQTNVAPQTIEQSRKTFLATMNLDTFIEIKHIDTCVKDHYDRISKDCLSLVIEMSKQDVSVGELGKTLNLSLEGAEKIVEGSVQRIKAMKPTGRVGHGDDNSNQAS